MSEKTQVPGVTLSAGCAGGTGRRGLVSAGYARLVELLGEPNGATDCYKVSTKWDLTFEGQTITVYDYGETCLYDPNYLSVMEFRALPSYEWHVGGGDPAVAERFIVALKAAL